MINSVSNRRARSQTARHSHRFACLRTVTISVGLAIGTLLVATGCSQLIPDELFRSAILASGAFSLANIVDADLYVSPNGRAEWSGRLREPNGDKTDGPLPTVEAARDALRRIRAVEKPRHEAGWVVLLAPGTYELQEPLVFGPEDSGTSDTPVIYACFNPEGAAISGGRRITGWKAAEVDGKKCWTVELAEVKAGKWCPRQLFVNGQRRPRTRLPREGYFEFAGSPQINDKTPWGEGQTEAIFKPGDIRKWRNLGDVEAVALHFWIESRLPLMQVDEAEKLVKFTRKSTFRLTDDHNIKKGARYYIENVFEAFDTPGQWYVDRPAGMLYYMPMPGETPENTTIIVPRLPQLLRVVGDRKNDRPVKWIVFLGLDFSHADWSLPADKAGSVQAAFEVPGALYFQDADSCIVSASRIRHVSGYAVEFAAGCENNTVENCELTDLGAGGVKMWQGSSHTTVHNNEIGPGGIVFHSAVGVLVGPSGDNTVSHNHIHDFNYTGVSVGWSWGYAVSPAVRNIVEYNHIHDIGKGMLSDMGGIYTLGVSPNTRLRYNLIHDVEAHTYGGWGIYNDEGSTHILIENNIVYRTKHAGYHQHYGKENYIRNNIFAFGREAQITRSREEEHISFIFERNVVLFDNGKLLNGNWGNEKFVMDYNLYWRTDGRPFDFAGVSFEDWKKRGHDRHSLIADPGFVDPARGDFSFKPDDAAHRIGFQPIDTSKIGRLR